MKFTLAVAAAFVGAAVAASNETQLTVTETVSSYVTYCPFPTTIVENNKTYTVTEATTLTITDCPCTRTKTYTTITTSTCEEGCPGAPTDTPVHYPNTTVVIPTGGPVPPSPPSGNNTVVPTSPPEFEGAASRATIAGGALAGIVGLVAYLL
ncbi:hypothetical protein BJ508DRAFT_315009 [Ascobolus immersus RN42]|uniref:Clock-controlled protein 6 n=1 Tax=Ascobolus immersus RN42 TaxID=1160509 RepID=A0A3N4HCQ5_ASCIM|nr:hypothetical protein BJ508DRAFT_315009 [Ascobolus immersus RN42]